MAETRPSLPVEISRGINSHWDGCIKDVKAACLASHFFRHLYQPLIFRAITLIDQDPESAATMIDKLLAAFEENRHLAPLIHELEWRIEPVHQPDMLEYPDCSVICKTSGPSTSTALETSK